MFFVIVVYKARITESPYKYSIERILLKKKLSCSTAFLLDALLFYIKFSAIIIP